MTDAVVCNFCGRGVNWKARNGSVLRQVEGWEEPRAQGGANKIIGRRLTGRWAHASCQATEGFATTESLW